MASMASLAPFRCPAFRFSVTNQSASSVRTRRSSGSMSLAERSCDDQSSWSARVIAASRNLNVESLKALWPGWR
eukprot:6322346-Alexandrium_andersonii.AAC.1